MSWATYPVHILFSENYHFYPLLWFFFSWKIWSHEPCDFQPKLQVEVTELKVDLDPRWVSQVVFYTKWFKTGIQRAWLESIGF